MDLRRAGADPAGSIAELTWRRVQVGAFVQEKEEAEGEEKCASKICDFAGVKFGGKSVVIMMER